MVWSRFGLFGAFWTKTDQQQFETFEASLTAVRQQSSSNLLVTVETGLVLSPPRCCNAHKGADKLYRGNVKMDPFNLCTKFVSSPRSSICFVFIIVIGGFRRMCSSLLFADLFFLLLFLPIWLQCPCLPLCQHSMLNSTRPSQCFYVQKKHGTKPK